MQACQQIDNEFNYKKTETRYHELIIRMMGLSTQKIVNNNNYCDEN